MMRLYAYCAGGGLKGSSEELQPATPRGFDITDKDTLAPLMANWPADLAWPVLVHCFEPAGHTYPGKGATTPDKVYRL